MNAVVIRLCELDLYAKLRRTDRLGAAAYLPRRRCRRLIGSAAGAQLKSLEVDAISTVWRAYYEFQTALSRYEYAKALLAASQESYDANLDTYRQGLSTIVELLTADRDLANARYTIVQSRADLLTSSLLQNSSTQRSRSSLHRHISVPSDSARASATSTPR